jgi:cytochrome P450
VTPTPLAELDLPRFEYLDPELRGDRFHAEMRALRDRSWLAAWDLGYFVLDRESAGFFLRTDKAAFPGVMLLELVGITDGPLYESLSSNIISLTGDHHRRLRRLVHDSFTPKAADRYRPVMRDCLAELYEQVADAGRCDFVRAFAKPYPARMIAAVIGAPLADAERLHELSNLLQSQFDAIALTTRRAELEDAAVEFDAYVEGLVSERRDSPGDDLVSRLIAAEQEATGCPRRSARTSSGTRSTAASTRPRASSPTACGCSPATPTSGGGWGRSRRSRRRPPRRCCASSQSPRSPRACCARTSSTAASCSRPAPC